MRYKVSQLERDTQANILENERQIRNKVRFIIDYIVYCSLYYYERDYIKRIFVDQSRRIIEVWIKATIFYKIMRDRYCHADLCVDVGIILIWI